MSMPIITIVKNTIVKLIGKIRPSVIARALLLRVLTDSIERVDTQAQTRHDETITRLDSYIASSEERLRHVENSQLITSQTIAAHEDRFKALEESGEEHWVARHPILAGAVNFVIVFILVAIIAKLAPGIAKLVGSI